MLAWCEPAQFRSVLAAQRLKVVHRNVFEKSVQNGIVSTHGIGLFVSQNASNILKTIRSNAMHYRNKFPIGHSWNKSKVDSFGGGHHSG